jgi:hypothetical protein
VTTDSDSGANVKQKIYDSGDTLKGTADETSSYTVSSLSSGSTLYVVIVVDTTLSNTGTGDDLSGTIKITST